MIKKEFFKFQHPGESQLVYSLPYLRYRHDKSLRLFFHRRRNCVEFENVLALFYFLCPKTKLSRWSFHRVQR